MKKEWIVTLGADHGTVKLYDYSLKNLAKLKLETLIFEFDGRVAHHWLCGAGLPELFWRIPMGKPVYDTEWLDEKDRPMLDNSFAGLVYSTSSRFMNWITNETEKDLVTEYEVTVEEALRLDPRLKESFCGDDED